MMSAKQICFLLLIVAVVGHDVFVDAKHAGDSKAAAKSKKDQTAAQKGFHLWGNHHVQANAQGGINVPIPSLTGCKGIRLPNAQVQAQGGFNAGMPNPAGSQAFNLPEGQVQAQADINVGFPKPECQEVDLPEGQVEGQDDINANVSLLNDEISACEKESERLREERQKLCTRLTATFTGDDLCQVDCEDKGYLLLPLLPRCEDGDYVDGVNCCIDGYEGNDCFRTLCPPKLPVKEVRG